jgi:predicted DNA-binding transcriptional regulator AlpA
MDEQIKIVEILQEIKNLLSQNKKVLNVDDLAEYTGLSKSKIYKLTQLKLIPMGNNQHVRQKFFDKNEIDAWLLGEPILSDEALEQKFSKQLLRNRKRGY